jgi:ribosomal protein S18 acetylase RimI-like enzyme
MNEDEPLVTVEAARPDDVDVIVRMNQLLAEESEGRSLDPAVIRAGVAAVLADSQKGTYWVARAKAGGAVVGQTLVTTEWSDWRNGWFWWLQSVYVEREHRRTGVFRALYRQIAHTARNRWDVCGVRLYVERSNTVAQRTYEAIGFVTTDYLVQENDWSKAVT